MGLGFGLPFLFSYGRDGFIRTWLEEESGDVEGVEYRVSFCGISKLEDGRRGEEETLVYIGLISCRAPTRPTRHFVLLNI